MKAITRQIAIGGLIIMGITSIVAAILTQLEGLLAITSNVVLGIVGILKQNEDGGE